MEAIANHAIFQCTLKAQREAELIIEELEEAGQKKMQEIECYRNDLINSIPYQILDMPIGKVEEAGYDISKLLMKMNPIPIQNPGVSNYYRQAKEDFGFDSDSQALRSVQTNLQAYNHSKANKYRWKTPTKSTMESATKNKLSSQKKKRFFKGNSGQKENQLTSGKKLCWKR
jgi:hypothetical protein